jgi:hypothetical protein
MKANYYLKTSSLCLNFLMIAAIISCNEDNNVIKEDDVKAAVTTFSPLSGGKNTILTLHGSNFGADTTTTRVTVNEKEAIIHSMSDEEIIAEVQKGSGSGLVRIYLGVKPHIQVLIYAEEFTYEEEIIYETSYKVLPYIGSETGEAGKTDGAFDVATLSRPRFLQWSADSTLYIVEEDGNLNDVSATDFAGIRAAKNNNLTTLLNADNTTLLQRIRAISFSSDQNTMYIANDINGEKETTVGFCSMDKNGANLSTLWGTGGKGITFTKAHPVTGAIFVGVHANAWVYEYNGSDFVQKAQLPSTTTGTPANKGNINGMVFDADSTVYIASRVQHVIYKGTYNVANGNFSNLTIFAGTYGSTGYVNGTGAEAKFNTPCQIDMDAEGNLYVADRANHCIRKITPEGEVSTYAGTNESGMVNGLLSEARFNNPEGCQLGPDGALYIADYGNNRICKIEEVKEVVGEE